MLVLTRRIGEILWFDDNFTIKVLGIFSDSKELITLEINDFNRSIIKFCYNDKFFNSKYVYYNRSLENPLKFVIEIGDYFIINKDIVIKMLRRIRNQTTFGIDAPAHVNILRGELKKD